MPEKRMLWLDMETTGDRPMRHRILEIAWTITDENLTQLIDVQSCVVKHKMLPEMWQHEMIPVVEEMHETSGLLAAIQAGPALPLDFIEDHICYTMRAVARRWRADDFPDREDVSFQWELAGSGVSQLDSQFIQFYMPKLQQYLVYHFCDIGQVRRFLRDKVGMSLWPEDQALLDHTPKTHRAADDIKQHLMEAQLWQQQLRDMMGSPLRKPLLTDQGRRLADG